MSAIAELLSELRQRNVNLWLEGDRLRYRAAKAALTPDLLAQMKDHKADLIAFLREATVASRQPRPPIVAVDRDRPLPLSFAQQRLWFLHQFEPDSSSNNMPVVVRFSGALDVALLEESLRIVIQRHEVLRTTFPAVNGQPTIAIAPDADLTLPIVDLSHLPTEQVDEAAHQLATQAARQPFDLAAGPTVRVTLFRLSADQHLLLWNMHCIVCDGTSSDIFYQDLTAIYAALQSAQPVALPPLPLQYADFAQWQRNWLQGDVLESLLSYWKQQLQGNLSVVDLPTDFPRPPLVQTYRGDRYARMLPKPLMASLTHLSQQLGTTLFTTLIATFQILLHRYSGQEDLLLSFVSSGRDQVEVERVMGFFSNTLILRTHFDQNPTFRELLQRVHRSALDAQAHQDLPFEKLVEEIRPAQAAGRSPLFQVKFALNPPWTNGRGMGTVQLPNLSITSLFGYIYHGKTKFDLALVMREQDQGLGAVFDYNAELFDASTMIRMMDHLQMLLEGIVADPDRRIADLPLLKLEERYQLLTEWNEQIADEPTAAADLCLHQLFEAQAAQTPDAIALISGAQSLTYQELNDRAAQLAQSLQSQGVAPAISVAVWCDQLVDRSVAILGILKAGGTVLPLDPRIDSLARVAHTLHTVQPRIILTSADRVAELPTDAAQIVVLADRTIAPRSHSPVKIALDAPAFLLDAGIDRVTLTHGNLVNASNAIAQAFELTQGDRVLQFAFTLAECFAAWSRGAAVAGLETDLDSAQISSAQISQAIEQQITVLMLATNQWHTWVQALANSKATLPAHLRLVVTSGNPVFRETYDAWLSRVGQHPRWLHTYGAIETAGIATLYDPTLHALNQRSQLAIGRPIANVQTYVLDRYLQPVPIGFPGELYIGGVGVSLGYLNRADRTAARFLPNPFSKEAGSYLYKTGDRARYLLDGTLELLRPLSDRVVRGNFSVELDQISATIKQHPAIAQAAIVERFVENLPLDAYIDVYVVLAPDADLTIDELHRFLQSQLPTPLLPKHLVVLNDLPLSPTGRVDRSALPDPALPDEKPIVTFRDEIEQQLTQLWENVLEIGSIDVQDNFFEIGGHSLLAVRLFTEIEKTFGKILPLSVLLQAPTIEQLAQVLRTDAEPSWSPLVTIQAGNPAKPSLFCIHGGGFNVLIYRHLAINLGPEQTVYGLQAQGLDGKAIRDRLEDIASDYIQQIQSIQPEGPYFLAGLSNGGNIALEMAQQLCAQGEKVGLLALFDTYAPNAIKLMPPFPRLLSSLVYAARYSLPRFAAKLPNLKAAQTLTALQAGLKNVNRKPISDRASAASETEAIAAVDPRDKSVEDWMNRISQYVLDHSPWSFFTPSVQLQEVDGSLPSTLKKMEESYQKIHKSYTPKSYPGRIILFRAMETPPGYQLDPYLGWKSIAQAGIEVHSIPGHHTALLESPVLAQKLAPYL